MTSKNLVKFSILIPQRIENPLVSKHSTFLGSQHRRSHEVTRSAGPLIRKTRDARGWTQDQLAAHLQLSGLEMDRVAVAKIESQIRSLLDFELVVFAEVLEMSVSELLPSFKSVKRDLDDLIKGEKG